MTLPDCHNSITRFCLQSNVTLIVKRYIQLKVLFLYFFPKYSMTEKSVLYCKGKDLAIILVFIQMTNDINYLLVKMNKVTLNLIR